MMRPIKLFLLTIAVVLSSCSHTGKIDTEINYDGHPIIGVWSIEVNGCIETHEFLPNGTRNVTSRMEVVEAVYTISIAPRNSSFFKMKDTVIKDNGKKDCLGSTSDMTGDVVERYIAFSPNRDEMVVCLDESFDLCSGPLRKK